MIGYCEVFLWLLVALLVLGMGVALGFNLAQAYENEEREL